jgi:hypothetical protein
LRKSGPSGEFRYFGASPPGLWRAPNPLLSDPPLLEVGPRRRRLGRLPEHPRVVDRRVVEQTHQAPPLVPPAGGVGGALLVLELDAVALGEPLHGADEVEVLGFLDEAEGIAAALAAEAVVELGHRVERERRGALLMEGAAGRKSRPFPLQLSAAADQVDHVDRAADGLDAVGAQPAHAGSSS